jgi:ABC-type transport system involved in multi-copper enzyme maturation permease subunit
MRSNQKQELVLVQDTDVDREKAGLKRHVSQIGNTITFEFKKNLKSFIIMLIVFGSVFSLLLLISELQLAQDVVLPSEPVNYVKDYLTQFFGFLIIISASLFGGSIIVEDFKKQTGNLLFPKISKTRLLIGRLASRYTLNAICVGFYYFLIGIVTYVKYEEIPITLWASLGWALLYTFAILTFVTFMSSIMRSTSATIIVSILFLLIVFHLITMILRFAGLTMEPLFLLTYYEGIISGSLSMPNPRYTEIMMPTPGGGDPVTFTQWLTPTEPAALIGMLIYIGVLLALAYFIYQRRQSKSE